MEKAYGEVVTAALALPPDARVMLMEELLSSIETSQAEVDAAWHAEIERRVKEIAEGKVQLIPGEQVMSELRAQLKR